MTGNRLRGKCAHIFGLVLGCLFVLLVSTVQAADDNKANLHTKETELAKKVQNPISDLVSIPFQNNINFGYGSRKNTQYILNIQPVVPLSLNKEWNLITRTLIPVADQPVPERKFGLGDVQVTLLLSSATSGKLTWGLGPIFQFPTATGDSLGQGKFAAGPAAAVIYMKGPWVMGVIGNNIWSYAGESDRPAVNQFQVQPLINYNLPRGWYISVSPLITANWKADYASDRWTVPLGGGVGKIFKIGKLPFNGSLAVFSNVVKPEAGPDWSIRAQIGILLPKALFD
jgi:hypothetical protein